MWYRTATLGLCVLLAGTWGVVNAAAEDEETRKPLEVGDPAPDFVLPKQNDEAAEPKKLSSLKGKKNVLVAFYPKAFTPGCTTQLCGYRDGFAAFESNDTDVVAISNDEQSRSDDFKKEHALPFLVLGDVNATIIKAYGVPMRSRGTIEFAQRCVFLIDKAGIIRYIDMDYHVENGKKPLFEAIAQLEADDNDA